MIHLYKTPTRARIARLPGHETYFRAASALAMLSALAACGDSASNPRTIAVPASIVVTSSATNLASLQQTVTLTAVVKDRSGEEIRGVPLIWTAENPAILESVGNGVFRSMANGQTVVKVDVDPSYPGVSKSGYSIGTRGTVTIVVQQQPAGVRIFPAAKTLWALAQRSQLSAKIVDANGFPIESEDYPVAWSSDSTNIATVDNAGQIAAVHDGIAVVTASSQGYSATAPIIVSATSPLKACFKASITSGGAPSSAGSCVSVTVTVKDRQP